MLQRIGPAQAARNAIGTPSHAAKTVRRAPEPHDHPASHIQAGRTIARHQPAHAHVAENRPPRDRHGASSPVSQTASQPISHKQPAPPRPPSRRRPSRGADDIPSTVNFYRPGLGIQAQPVLVPESLAACAAACAGISREHLRRSLNHSGRTHRKKHRRPGIPCPDGFESMRPVRGNGRTSTDVGQNQRENAEGKCLHALGRRQRSSLSGTMLAIAPTATGILPGGRTSSARRSRAWSRSDALACLRLPLSSIW